MIPARIDRLIQHPEVREWDKERLTELLELHLEARKKELDARQTLLEAIYFQEWPLGLPPLDELPESDSSEPDVEILSAIMTNGNAQSPEGT